MDEVQGFQYLPNIDDRIHKMNMRLGHTKPTSSVGNTIAQKTQELLQIAAQQQQRPQLVMGAPPMMAPG